MMLRIAVLTMVLMSTPLAVHKVNIACLVNICKQATQQATEPVCIVHSMANAVSLFLCIVS